MVMQTIKALICAYISTNKQPYASNMHANKLVNNED